MAVETPKDILKRRLTKCRNDLLNRAVFINEVYRLSQPQRERVGEDRKSPLSTDEVQDLLDLTFAQTTDDYASDMIASFTPPYEPWVRHKPSAAIALTDAMVRSITDQIRNAVNWFWDDVQESNYYDAADECFHDLCAGTMAIRRLEYGPTQPICYEPVPTKNLLIDVGPDKTPDARFSEGRISKRAFIASYGQWLRMDQWPPTLKAKFSLAKEETEFRISDGVHRVWDKPGQTWWRRAVLFEGEIIYERFHNEDGWENLYVARWRTETSSAYGIGPGWWACAPARALNEVQALILGAMHNFVDPAHGYSDPDGGINLEQGVSAGDWLLFGEGFNVEKLNGDGELQASFYSQETMQELIKRALHQEKPEQKGRTPPSASQWADESARAQQRWEIPRGKIYREWVMPIVRGHQWQRTAHGLFPPIKLGSQAIILIPQSPQAKARAFEKVTKAERVLMSAASPVLQQQAMVAIDVRATLDNMKREIGDDLVVVLSEADFKQRLQDLKAAAIAQQQQQQTPTGAQPVNGADTQAAA